MCFLSTTRRKSAFWQAREQRFFQPVLCKICTKRQCTSSVALITKEVSSMELKELVLEVEELEEKIAPAMGSVGGH
jgi:hypothetical protein